MKTHRFYRGITACGVEQGVNAADMEPPEVTCRRCIKANFAPDEFSHHHYARAEGRVFLAPGLPPDPERSWTAQYMGPLA